MNRDYLNICKAYSGGSDFPEWLSCVQYGILFWEAERAWCGLQETEQGRNDLGSMLDEYLANGLRDFENMDGVPVSLKAVLFNRFSHWNRESTAEFKAWYLATITQRKPTGTLAGTFTQRVLPAYLALSPKMEERLC